MFPEIERYPLTEKHRRAPISPITTDGSDSVTIEPAKQTATVAGYDDSCTPQEDGFVSPKRYKNSHGHIVGRRRDPCDAFDVS